MYKRWQKLHSGGIEFRVTDKKGNQASKWYDLMNNFSEDDLLNFEEFKAWAFKELEDELKND